MSDTPFFQPDWLSPPGDTIEDALNEMGITQYEFARRTGFNQKHINGLIEGKIAITTKTAIKLETVLGEPTSFWLEREAQYQKAVARHKVLD